MRPFTAAAVLASLAAFAALPAVAAQEPPQAAAPTTTAPKPPVAAAALPPVSLDLRDVPVRTALQELFQNAHVQYTIDPRVSGYVTLKIADQPFDNALRLLMRVSGVPLRYTVQEGGVYVVEPRPLPAPQTYGPPPVSQGTLAAEGPRQRQFATITLTYIDPFDLAQILGITHQVEFMSRGNWMLERAGLQIPRMPGGGGGGGQGQGASNTTTPTGGNVISGNGNTVVGTF
jgi:type II secretory pathway component GspD/PulD (secretin)